MEAQEPFFQALEVHFQPLDAQNEPKEAFAWAKEAGATLPVRKCAASSAGGFLSGAGGVQQAQEAHIHLLHARPRANKAICWMPEAQRHAQEAQRQACILAARGLHSPCTGPALSRAFSCTGPAF